jgi:hypothetical protein
VSEPNKHGVYPDHFAEHVTFSVGNKASCDIAILEVEGEWLVSVDHAFTFGDMSSGGGPLMRDEDPHTSRLSALTYGLDCALRHFHTRERWGCATPKQVQVSIQMNSQISNYRANLSGDSSALPVGIQLSMFEALA